MSASTCLVDRWSQFHHRDKKQARALLIAVGHRRVADRLRRREIEACGLQPTGVFCPHGLTLLAIGAPVRQASRRAGIVFAFAEADRKLELMPFILHDQVAQLGQAYEAGGALGVDALVVAVRVAEYPFGGPRPVAGAEEMLALVERDFGMQLVDRPKTRARRREARRFRFTYRGLSAARAAEIYANLPPPSQRSPQPPSRRPPLTALAASVAPARPGASPAAPDGRMAETKLEIRAGLGGGFLGYNVSGEIKHTRRLYLSEAPEAPSADEKAKE